jgi:hypothetical protein
MLRFPIILSILYFLIKNRFRIEFLLVPIAQYQRIRLEIDFPWALAWLSEKNSRLWRGFGIRFLFDWLVLMQFFGIVMCHFMIRLVLPYSAK